MPPDGSARGCRVPEDEKGLRHALRRGARFEDELRDVAPPEDIDHEDWLADLRQDLEELDDEGDERPPRRISKQVLMVLAEELARVEERLVQAEEAVARARASCTASRSLLAQVRAIASGALDDERR